MWAVRNGLSVLHEFTAMRISASCSVSPDGRTGDACGEAPLTRSPASGDRPKPLGERCGARATLDDNGERAEMALFGRSDGARSGLYSCTPSGCTPISTAAGHPVPPIGKRRAPGGEKRASPCILFMRASGLPRRGG